MRLPRDLSGNDLAQALRKLGYQVTRQTGSHIRLTTTSGILADVAEHFELSREELAARLFEK